MPRREAETYTDEEMANVIAALPRRTITGARDRAAILVMWKGGLRLTECLALKASDVDLEGSGGMVFPEPVMAAIRAWMKKRAALESQPGPDDPLFCSIYGRRQVHPSHFRHKLPRIAAKIGMAKRLHAQGFRQRKVDKS